MTSSANPAPGGIPPNLVVPDATGWSRRTWALLAVLCGALFLDGLDISMVGVALPSLGADLGMEPAALQWIVSGYVLGYGGLLLLGGRAADLLGRRPVFLVAVAVFGVASVASAFLSDDLALVALRFVKGVAAAFTVPAGLSIITTTFAEGPARNRALSFYTVCGASGFSLGLVAGGLLTGLGWRATFLMPGPVALLLVLAGLAVVPRTRRAPLSLRSLDLTGAATVTAALLLLVYGLVEAPGRGWASPATWGTLAAAAVLFAVFVAVERRSSAPLVRLGILRSTSLVHANVTGAVMAGAYFSFQFVVTLYLQNSLGWSPLAMALGFLPAGLLVVLSATKMDVVLDRFGTARIIAAGMAAFTLGYALFLRVQPGAPYAQFLLPTILLVGVGFALTFPSINAQATAGVADSEQGLASGLVNTSVQVGGAVTLAVVSAVTATAQAPVPGTLPPGMVPAIGVVTALSAAGTVVGVGALLLARRARRDAATPAARAVPAQPAAQALPPLTVPATAEVPATTS